ncbi:MAG: ABC-F family ATP-binding cassette domain-containing protein [Cyclobacteriaceae bacterium]
MISINNLTFSFGGRDMYSDLNWHIKPKEKIGLIGYNGAGKSTLLRILVGEYQPNEGTISRAKDCTIGFLNQDLLSYESEKSILAVAMEAFEEATHAQQQIDKLLAEMETNYSDDLIDKLTKWQERFEALEGYTIQSKAEEILEGLSFSTADLQKPLKEFSGGWRMRVMLAKLLLAAPSLLLLDEPTNHLDLPTIQWIEKYINNYEGAVVIVSHDRAFLNNTVEKVAEVHQQQLALYEGNYNFYLTERELRHEIQHNAFKNQQKTIKEAEQFVQRFKAKASKAKQAQSRVKMLEKIDRIEDVVDENASISFQFNFGRQSGKVVTEFKNLSKSYGDLEILKNTSNYLERGDKIALVGANGKGKSTVLRIIDGTEEVDGERIEGHNVSKAFFAQHQLESLTLTNTILEELVQSGSEKTELEIRGILGCFLFTDDDVHKQIKVLSGGEKSRVALAKTLLSESNFLLLDEPTNHLDIQSVNMLVQAMQQYQGSFLVVSHDRHFVQETANKIWWIEDGEIKEYPGTYKEFDHWYENRKSTQVTAAPKKKEKKEKVKQQASPDHKKLKETKQLVRSLEEQIAELEDQKSAKEKELAKESTYANPELLAQYATELKQVESELERVTEKWETAYEEMESLA